MAGGKAFRYLLVLVGDLSASDLTPGKRIDWDCRAGSVAKLIFNRIFGCGASSEAWDALESSSRISSFIFSSWVASFGSSVEVEDSALLPHSSSAETREIQSSLSLNLLHGKKLKAKRILKIK